MSLEQAKKRAKPWFQYALEDLQAAKFLNTGDSRFFRILVFNCQQSVEKSLKGFLVYHGKAHQKIHNIRKLSESIIEVDPSLEALLEVASVLTAHALGFRYPDGGFPEITKSEVVEGLALAEKVFEEITRRIPFETRMQI